MLTKNQSKRILSLRQKKQRLKQGLFTVEGPKVVQEFIDSNYELVEVFSINNNYAHFKEKLTIIAFFAGRIFARRSRGRGRE